MKKPLFHRSFFTGIGGFDLACEMEGIATVSHSEIDKFCVSKLKKWYPNVIQLGDITRIRKKDIAGRYSIFTGGFPCQDISISGAGTGISGERSGLWKHFYRVIRMGRPRYVIIENSSALISRGLEHILCDLTKIGYMCEWQCISNKIFGYPHQRERIYIIAYPYKKRCESALFVDGKFKSIFKKGPSAQADIYSTAERIYSLPNSEVIRNDVRVPRFDAIIGALGNGVNVTVARYLIKCVKFHYENS